jgi:acetyl esterase/lipase
MVPTLRSLAAALALTALFVSVAEAQSPRERLAALRADRPGSIPEGTLTSIEHLLDTADRIEPRDFEAEAEAWRRRARRYLELAAEGTDPYPLAKNEIVNRGYRSPISQRLQGYAIYIPPDYDPSRRYPLYVALHGGSSNGNLFLGVVLGNNMDWETYDEHLFDDYTPRWSPDWIVVAPTGYGQIMWRWMGEQDVLDVIDDVQAHYAVDPDRVVLGGLSNGGVGAYAIGMRHSWRFAMVQAMAGAPSWEQYLGGRMEDAERRVVRPWSGLHLAENSVNTSFRYYHGREDTGPMRPRYVEEFTRHLESLDGVPVNETWFDAGHDILYRVHRHGRVYDRLSETRDPRPDEVRVVTGDYRAARQHWLSVTRIRDYPQMAEARGAVTEGTLTLTPGENVDALALHVGDVPFGASDVRIVVGEGEVFEGPVTSLGTTLNLVRTADGWRTGFPPSDGLRKRPGLSGPISDAYFGRMIHVYGTRNEDHTEDLREAAQRGARGWPLWSWDLTQEVVADSDVTEAMMANATVVLYGSPGDNALLQRVAGALPIRVEEGAVVVGDERFTGDDVGVRFIHPNPLAPERYLIVQAGVTPRAVKKGNELPEFVPDYLVYDDDTVSGPQRRTTGPKPVRAMGFFDDRWRLPGAADADAEGAGPDQNDATAEAEEEEPSLPVPPAPAVPEPPGRFHAPRSDQAGMAARRIARIVPSFENYRAAIGGAEWEVRRRAVWSIGPTDRCLAELRELGVEARPRPEPHPLTPSPVELLGPVDGVWFRMTHEEQPLVLSCEMAKRLPTIIDVLKDYGIHGIEILSAHRDYPRTSFHRMGLALDLMRFWTDDGWLSVEDHYEATPMQETCSGPRPRGRRARQLRAIACRLWQSEAFSSVLTPNYNEGHRDHFHVDARPDDPRLFLR